ncbi:MAG: hypothetical protein H0V22_11375 [Solirubrobacterales bacterium]|jgi:hypothetical protein|nr:hypothetical protein [Solirubrobacterales bacterium]
MLRRSLVPALAALLLAGCGAGAKSSTADFSGEDKRVAQVLEDLQAAGETGDAAEICSRILSAQLVDRLKAKGSSCTQELDDALGDADDFELGVERVQVTGTSATATVSNGDGRPQLVKLVRERRGWRVSELS